MGKLHKIRKAIEANPEKWFSKTRKTLRGSMWIPVAYAARRDKGQWEPTFWSWDGNAYRDFVAHTLRNLGYDVK